MPKGQDTEGWTASATLSNAKETEVNLETPVAIFGGEYDNCHPGTGVNQSCQPAFRKPAEACNQSACGLTACSRVTIATGLPKSLLSDSIGISSFSAAGVRADWTASR